jgi:hypothetical protein
MVALAEVNAKLFCEDARIVINSLVKSPVIFPPNAKKYDVPDCPRRTAKFPLDEENASSDLNQQLKPYRFIDPVLIPM